MLGSWSLSRTTDLRVVMATPQQDWCLLQPRHTSLCQRSAVQSQSLLPRIITATTPLRAGLISALSTQWIMGLLSGFHLCNHGSDVVTMMVSVTFFHTDKASFMVNVGLLPSSEVVSGVNFCLLDQWSATTEGFEYSAKKSSSANTVNQCKWTRGNTREPRKRKESASVLWRLLHDSS